MLYGWCQPQPVRNEPKNCGEAMIQSSNILNTKRKWLSLPWKLGYCHGEPLFQIHASTNPLKHFHQRVSVKTEEQEYRSVQEEEDAYWEREQGRSYLWGSKRFDGDSELSDGANSKKSGRWWRLLLLLRGSHSLFSFQVL